MWDTLILNPFTNALVWIYTAIGHNFGIAIILFTILIRLVTWPLNGQQLKSTKVMQDLQTDKEWLDIQKKYAKDREKLAQEQMRIYQERGINPFASCLPTLIQFPIIIGLYQSITRALATTPLGLLQLARSLYPVLNSALLIPLNSKFLWMDLGRPEGIPLPGGLTFSFLPYGFPTLALIVALTTYLQTKLTMPAANPNGNNPNDQTAVMNSTMSIYMPLLLGYFALNFASGLAVYFVTSNVLGIVQYAMMGRVNWRNLLPGGSQPATSSKSK
ncbi:MAG TPA: YidC/Oxa1 family membrane protein insertase [Anaerolineales bacterium]|jgi:YidC/Oxa1 family membrane protein insertase|nr:YidC/Oxa1 family membrane protein insertase [Anaerolineales bacterium]